MPGSSHRERLKPSRVATRDRSVTQPQALDLYRRHPDAAGLQWWSRGEAMWTHITLFDRTAPILRLIGARELTLEHPVLREAANLFGLHAARSGLGIGD